MRSESEALLEAPPWARTMLVEGRVARMATADAEGRPSVVAVCYVLEGAILYSPIDGKPKSGRSLRRVRDLEVNANVALVVDRWDEDWRRLAWVSVRGQGTILEAAVAAGNGDRDREVEPRAACERERRAALASLRVKYPQYGHTNGAPLDDSATVIRIEIEAVRWWRFASGVGD